MLATTTRPVTAAAGPVTDETTVVVPDADTPVVVTGVAGRTSCNVYDMVVGVTVYGVVVTPSELTAPFAVLAPSTSLTSGTAVTVLPRAPVVVGVPATIEGSDGGVGTPKLSWRPFPSMKSTPEVPARRCQPEGGSHVFVAKSYANVTRTGATTEPTLIV